ncbi:MAG TPA: mechanosensitive ion channel [Candidatus Krumholzibacteria bacterium]|nr:mechanosensitive ion channel [Candidatus Krumholzibacteria bacterium]HRX51736.1 mechanosensitive ion channel [Candidatus Krumholzibacteria bacterium]
MESGFSLRDAVSDVLASLSGAFAAFVPRALTALVVLLVGLILAKVAAKSIRTAFARFRIDELLQRVGMTDVLRRLGLQNAPGEVLARLVYYLLILLFVQSAAAAVGLAPVADAVTAFFSYLPNLVAALLVLVAGMMVAQFAGGAVTRAARDSGVEFAPVLGRAVSTLVLFVVVVMAVTQLRIDTEMIRSTVLTVLAGIALALALSFGLGTRDITRNLVAGFYARRLFEVGEPIEMAGRKGVLAGVTSTQTLLEEEGRITAVPNSVFLEEAVRQ